MSEVKRYAIRGAGKWEAYEVKAGAWVRWHDFDAQRLRADTAEAELKALKHPMNSAQQLRKDLAAAEQRIADVSATLAGALKLLRGVHTGDLFGPDDWETVNEFLLGADAALNPNPEAEKP